MPAVVAGPAFRLGVPTPLHELVPAAAAAQLEARGQRLCPVASDLEPLLVGSIEASLAAAAVDPAEVGRVLLTSESIVVAPTKAAHEAARAVVYTTLASLGLGHAPVALMTYAGCSSAVAALEYASLLVETSAADHVLVVSADRVLDERERVLQPSVSVVGDGVASCVVTRADTGLSVRWVGRRAFLGVAKFDRATDFGPALVMLGRSLGTLGDRLREAVVVPTDAPLVCNNYGLPTLRLFARTLGVDDDVVFTDNVAATGHLGSPDVIVNLATVPDASKGVIVLGTGPADCALAFLSPVDGSR